MWGYWVVGTLTDKEVLDYLREQSSFNRARQVFSSWCGRIDQAQQQKVPLTPIELRRMEFEAVQNIAIALGVKLLG